MAFELFLVNHSHIDVGYTERQEKIKQYQADFIAQAVRYANSPKQQERRPDCRFKFTCEGFWPIEQYLQKYGQQGETELVQAIRSGYFELSGFYLHMTELLDQGHIEKSIGRAADFASRHHLPLDSAMASDINGFSWGVSEALVKHGVRYLISNINSHHGGAPFEGPNKPFVWQTPSGGKLLAWSGLPYHKANLLGLMAGLSPSSNPGVPGMKITESFGYLDLKDTFLAEKRVPELVKSLKENGYPYDFLPIMGSGVYTDNSPVGDGYCEIVRQWNEKYGDEIHIQTATVTEFFRYLESRLTDLPVYAGEWTDWWTDGTISMPEEVKVFRLAQRNKRLIEHLDPQEEIINVERKREIETDLFLFAEHTFGHSATMARPWDTFVQRIDARKRVYATQADIKTSEALDELMRGNGEGEFRCGRPFAYRIINPLNRSKKAVALLPVDFWELDLLKNGLTVADADGNEYPWQQTNTLRGRMIAIPVELAAGETRKVSIQTGQGKVYPYQEISSCFENAFYKIDWNESGITSWQDKRTGQQLLNPAINALGMPVYQIFPNAKRSDAAGFSYSPRIIPPSEIHRGKPVEVKITEQGPVFTSLSVQYSMPGVRDYKVILSMYRDLPLVEVTAEFTKEVVLQPEGVYIAFPFTLPGGKWLLDKPGALIEPGKDQLPGTCCDYYAVGKGAILHNEKSFVAINCYDAPMVTIGGLKLWQYTKMIQPEGDLYSWVTNNKWETNFPAQCGGCHQFRYVIEAGCQNGEEVLDNNEYPVLVVRE